MKSASQIHLSDVQAVYSGPEGRLWELLMGEQIHIGGFQSSMDLAQRAGIAAGSRGVDLCCCAGAGHEISGALSQRGAHDRSGRHARRA